jgi:prolyl-tRNA synthetase
MSELFGQTLREVPADAEIASHQLLLRAGYIQQMGAGIFTYLHLAKRSMTKIEQIMREEIEAIGGQEISMPVVQPADLWKATGRWYQIGAEMGRMKDRNDRDIALAMTHEEAVAYLTKNLIQSYKQLPRLVYHIQTKWRDDPRPRAGLIRVREFTMKDSYTLDVDDAGLDKQYQAHYDAYFRIFARCGLPVVSVQSDVGMMGGNMAHEYMYLSPVGEDTLIICPKCEYIANRQVAAFQKAKAVPEEMLAIEKVATPAVKTIEELTGFLGIERSRTAKAVFMMGTFVDGAETKEKLVFAVIRGDMDVNETKLANVAGAMGLRPAVDEEIRAVGAVPGYASPLAVKGAMIVVDDSIVNSPNLVAGANEEGFHLCNVNYVRDFKAEVVADIAVAEAGHACPECGTVLTASRGVEVGNIFKLGTRYSAAVGATFLDKDGVEKPVVMGSYGIGVGRLLACAAEEYHDEHGLTWPVSIAPYAVHLVSLRGGEEEAAALYAEFQQAGVDVFFDDRDERPGVKFNDADLIGIPLRLTVSKRSLEAGGVEFKYRSGEDREVIPRDEVVAFIVEQRDALFAALEGQE